MWSRAPVVTSKASVKIVVDGEPRRVGPDYFDYNDFNKFCKQIETLYSKDGLCEALLQHRYGITYEDSEGDRIGVASTAELQESVRSQAAKSGQASSVLRYTVELNRAQPAQQTVSATSQQTPQVQETVEDVVTIHEEEYQPVVVQPTTTFVPEATPFVPTLEDMNKKALEYLEQRDYASARQLYHKAVQMHPQNHVLWYNLACTESMAGDLVGSWAALEQSILTGYRNWQHLMSDEDLKNLRNDWSCFQHVHRMMRYYGYDDQAQNQGAAVGASQTVPATDCDIEMELVEERITPANDQQTDQHHPIVVDEDETLPAVTDSQSNIVHIPAQWQQEALQLEEMGIPKLVIPSLLEQSKGNITAALDNYYGMQ